MQFSLQIIANKISLSLQVNFRQFQNKNNIFPLNTIFKICRKKKNSKSGAGSNTKFLFLRLIQKAPKLQIKKKFIQFRFPLSIRIRYLSSSIVIKHSPIEFYLFIFISNNLTIYIINLY